MFDEYSKGRTPNPDVLCNREIKFDAFMKVAEKYGAAMVATGHYCRKEAALDELGQPILDSEGKQIYRLLEGSDPNKDQSYFLCQLSQEQLSKTLFPIGELRKPEVRQKAKDESDKQYQFMIKVLSSLRNDGLVPTMTGGYVKEVKLLTCDGEPLGESPYDSEAIASLSDEVLERLSKPVKYDISFETEVYKSGKKHIKKTRYKDNPYGKILGKHEGAQFYTVGQRKGLSIGGHKEPVFVIDTDTQTNRVYVGEGYSHKGLYRFCLRINPDEVKWLRADLAMPPGEKRPPLRV